MKIEQAAYFVTTNFAIGLCGIGLAAAQTTAPIASNINVLQASKTQVYIYGTINPDCSPSGTVTGRIRKEPKHGTLELADEPGFLNYTAPNPRTKCNDQAVPVVKVYYKSNDGFKGKDAAEIEFFSSGGTSRKIVINIEVKD